MDIKIQGMQNLLECDEVYEGKFITFDLRIAFNTITILLTAKHSDTIMTGEKRCMSDEVFLVKMISLNKRRR